MSEEPEDIEEQPEEEEAEEETSSPKAAAYTCSDCGAIYPTIEELDHHEKTVH